MTGPRDLANGEYPSHGQMIVVPWDRKKSMFWFADRWAVVRDGRVELDGPAKRLIEAESDERGIVDFRTVREYQAKDVDPESAAGHAERLLRSYAEEALHPPYIADTQKRPKVPYLDPPLDTLADGDPVLLDAKHRWVRCLAGLPAFSQPDDMLLVTWPAAAYVAWNRGVSKSCYAPSWDHEDDAAFQTLIDEVGRFNSFLGD